MKRFLTLVILVLSLAPIASAQGGNTTVTAIIRDPNGALYTNSQVNITFFDPGTPGKQPLLNGSVFQTTYTIFATDSFGAFTQSVADSGIIDSSSGTVNTQWSFRVIYSDRLTSFIYTTPINCAANIPATCVNNTIDISAQLQAVAALLPAQAGGGGSFVVRAPPCASSIGFQMAGTFPTTANTAFKTSLTCNVTTTSITQAGGGTIQIGAIAQFTLTQDSVGGRLFNWPANFIDQPSIQAAANATTNASFWFDGISWHAQTFPASGGGGGNSAGVSGDVQKSNGTGGFTVAGINDNGTTIKVNEDVQFKGPNPYVDVTSYKARALVSPPSSTTATTTSTSTSVTLASAIDFVNGDGLVIYTAGPAPSITTPGISVATVTPKGISGGATTYNYRIVAEDFSGGLSAAAANITTTTGAASLGSNTASVTSISRAAGLTTFTTSGTHNFQAGEKLNITNNATFAGVFYINTTPLSNTFTILQTGQADATSTTATATVPAHNLVKWTGQSGVLRWWVYRGGALVGVAQGSEPYYDDYGYAAPAAPSYVPASPPAAAQNRYLATTIVSGAGTTSIVVADAASASVGAVAALHDNTKNVLNAITAITAIKGAQLYFPSPGAVNSYFIFNSTLNLPNPAGYTKVLLSGPILANQPWVVNSPFWSLEGLNGTSSGTQPSFGNSYYIDFTGTGYPLLYLLGGSTTNFEASHISFPAGQNQQWGVLLDATIGGAGAVNTIFQDNAFSSTFSGAPIVFRGGASFNHQLKRNVYNAGNGGSVSNLFYSPPSIKFTTSSQSAPNAGIGIVFIDDSMFINAGIGCDNDPAVPALSNGFNSVFIRNIFTESLYQPLLRCSTGGVGGNITNWNIENALIADTVTGPATPTFDFTGGPTPDTFNVINVPPMGTVMAGPVPLGLFLSGSSAPDYGSYVAIRNDQAELSGITYASGLGSTSTLESSAIVRVKGNGNVFYDSGPPSDVSAVVGAGGSVPIGTHIYRIGAVDANGHSTALSTGRSATTSGGNQTVTFTWTALAGYSNYNVYRDGVVLQIGGPVTGTVYVDTAASPGGRAAPVRSASGLPRMDAIGLATNNLGIGLTSFTSTATVPRSVTWANVGGTPAMGAPFTTNGILFGDGTATIQATAASGVGTFCLTETNGGIPVFGSCAGSAATAWSSLTNPSIDLSLNMSTFNTLFTSGVMTGTRHAWEFTDGNSTSTGSLFNLHTGTTSTMKPFTVTAQGTVNGAQMNTSGNLAPIGTGIITANAFSGLTTNLLLFGNGSGGISSLTGSLTGANPVLKLTSGAIGNVPFALDTPASPSADIFDVNINAVKTAWIDNLGIWHAPSYTASGAGALALSGTEGICPTPAGGIDILCIGDIATHTIKSSLNGAAYKDNAQFSNSGPAAHGVCLVGAIFPQLNCTSAGSSGQAFVSAGAGADGFFGVLGAVGGGLGTATNTVHGVLMGAGTSPVVASAAGTTGQAFRSGGAGADGSYGALDLAGGASIFTGVLPLANVNANIVTVTGAITPNDCVKWSSATVITDSGGTCGGAGGSARLDQLLGGTATNTINSTIFPQVWNWALTGSTTAMKFGENTAASGSNNILFQISTLNTSTATPFRADSNGNGVILNSSGLFTKVGTGAIDATVLSGIVPCANQPAETGDVTTSAGSCAATIAANAVTAAKSAVVLTRRECDIAVGDTSGSAITNAQLGPQKRVCKIPFAATVVEIDVSSDAGTPNVIVGRSRCTTFTANVCTAETRVNLTSAALAAATGGFDGCSNTGGTTGLDGGTTCSATLQNTGLNIGDYLELVSGTAGGTAKLMTIHVIYTVN